MNPEIIAHVPFFQNLPQSHLDLLAKLFKSKTFPAGHVIFKEGDPGEEIYIIVRGSVRISHIIHGGEEALAVLKDGQYFGEMALVDRVPRSAQAAADKETMVAFITRKEFDDLLKQHKELAYEILWTFVRTLSSRLRETNEKLKAVLSMSRFGG